MRKPSRATQLTAGGALVVAGFAGGAAAAVAGSASASTDGVERSSTGSG